jgi:hypothetical protein
MRYFSIILWEFFSKTILVYKKSWISDIPSKNAFVVYSKRSFVFFGASELPVVRAYSVSKVGYLIPTSIPITSIVEGYFSFNQ